MTSGKTGRKQGRRARIYNRIDQQNTQTQYPRHGEKPGVSMTQATTTAVLVLETQ